RAAPEVGSGRRAGVAIGVALLEGAAGLAGAPRAQAPLISSPCARGNSERWAPLCPGLLKGAHRGICDGGRAGPVQPDPPSVPGARRCYVTGTVTWSLRTLSSNRLSVAVVN